MRTEKFNLCKSTKKLLTLITLLTLGVGQMWAVDYLYLVPNSDWKGSSARFAAYFFKDGSGDSWVDMTKVTDDLYGVAVPTSNADKVIFCRMNGSTSANNWDNKWNQTGNLTVSGNTGKQYNITGWNESGNWGSTVSVFTKSSTLYLLPNSDWKSGARFAACFLGATEQRWVNCSQVGSTDYYSVTVPTNSAYPYVVFCRMKADDATNSWNKPPKWNQTSNLAPESGKNGVEITGWDNSSNWIVVYDGLSATRTPTAAANAPTIGQTLIKSGSNVSVSAADAKTGYHWVNWTSSNGTFGTAANQSTTFTPSAKNAVAQANYAENTFTVTINNDGNGSTNKSGAQSNIGQLTGIAINATPNTNYEFVNWTITSGAGSFASAATTASNTFYPTEASTIRANFRSTLSYSLTVSAGAGVSSVTGSNADITLGNTYAISATPTSGYTFSSWTASPAANASFASATSASTNVTVSNGSVTVTGTATENMRTVSIVASPTGAGTFTVNSVAGTSASVGVTTSKTIVATPITDFNFTSWSATNCTASPTNNKTTTLNGDGSTGSGTLTATFTPITCKVYKMNAAVDGGSTDLGTMSYDISKAAYYLDVTTNAKPYYFRFHYTNGDEYSATWGAGGYPNITEIVANGSKVDCNQKVIDGVDGSQSWEHKPAMYFNGINPSTIRIWFDYQNKKVWITEATYTVTINNGDHGTVSPNGAQSVGKNSGKSITATPATGYLFDNWSKTGNAVLSSTSTNPTTVTATNTGTVTANYKSRWAWVSNKNSWNDATNRLGNYATAGGKTTGYVELVDLAANTQYSFKFKDIDGSGTWYGPSSNTDITYTNKGTAQTMSSTDGGAPNQTITTAGAGTYRFTWNITDTKVTVTYPTSYTVTYYHKFRTIDGAISTATTGGSISGMSGSASGAQASGKYFNNTETVTLTHTAANSGYRWIGWYNSEACTSAYSTGGNVTINDVSKTIALSNLAANTKVAALFEEVGTTVTLANDGHGHIEINSATVTSTTVGKVTSRTIEAVPSTGYHFNRWTATSGTDYTIGSTSSASTSLTGKGSGSASQTVTVSFTANSYSVRFNRNGGTGGEDMDNQAFTYDAAQDLTTCTFSKTGYNFGGWATSQANADAGTKSYDDGEEVSNLSNTNGAIVDLFAIWTPKNYTVTLDKQTSAEGYGGNAGTVANQTVTFDATPATVSGTMPTAAQGYGFMGFYSEEGGNGRRFIDPSGNWVTSAGDTISEGNWVKPAGITLYAYYKKAQITNIAFSPGTTVSPNATVTLTPTVSPAPTGTTVICWKLLRNNGNFLSDDFEANPSTPGNNVTFTAPETSSSYKVAAVLRTGSGCGTGTVLDSVVYDLVVAGSHTVTIRYQDSDGRTLAASSETEGRPLAWSSEINPATITGYTFDHWVAGDGVTITTDDGETTVTETSTETIKIQATYDGPLTAVYNKKKMIFFNNTLNWDTVYVYFYKNSSYWDGSNGAGTDPSYYSGSYSGKHGGMTKIAGTSVYYFDAQAASADGYTNVAFTEKAQDNCWYFYEDNKVVRRTDYDATHLPMYVPLAGETGTKMNSNAATYYDKGYWMNYPENTGYWLKIYNQTATDGATKLYDLPFTFPEDHAMPLELAVDLEAGQTYGFEIARADGNNYRNTGTMTATTTDWDMTTGKTQYCGLQTTAAGEYIFRLAYFAVSSNYQYRVGVTYPVAVNDYRIVYTDGATWSKGAHGASWYHPSGVITKNNSATEVKNDTVSFFWSYGSSPAIAYQTCSAVAAGSASWSAGTSISVSDFSSVLKEKGVYNFIFQQPAGGASISLVKVEPYSGNYYIRTDCAGSTKWVNYRALDHQMTYSDYAEANSGYSHYFCHWVTTGTNVKFVIANDYNACISDTLSEDYGTTIADITAEGNDGAGTLNSGNASIRFMWNQKTNVINRAYISGSSNVSDRFLILEGDAKLYDENGNSYSISGLDANEVNLIDDQNFVYERTIKVNATARAKLTAKYNENVQYFKGSEGAFAEGTTVQLLGGTYDAEKKYSMRLVYDFKTDRLVTAYIPEGTVDAQLNIQADLMIIREHQEAGQQLLFSGSGALNEVQSVYGVMRFNRWTLNNRQHPEDHDKAHCWNDALITTYHPLLGPGNVKSSYERALYWISFPFDVNLSDVFGFGTYGTHWIIMKYNGAKRATDGYWKDSEGFWEYIWDRNGVTLEKGKGYVLALELELMQATDSVNFWTHQIQEVELFFPSASTEVGTITQTSVDVTVPPHECTIDRRTKDEKDAGTNNWNKDRTIADSHWNIIGVPSYANYGSTLSDGSSTITWNSNPKTQSLPFLYEWNASDNTYTVQSGTTYNFKAMHAYYVQYTGNLHWTLASATPPSIVARRTYAEAPESIEMKIELQQNEMMIDQTFVKLSNDENVSAGFAFGEDLNKEKNAGKANIYTFIDNYMPTAGNTMPMIDQTTFIPVGVSIPTAGEYTFAIPEGTDGVGVFLIDNVANTRTNLSALDYTVNLTTGTHDGRFILEISPIHNATTDIEAINDEGIKISGARKVLIDGILYIVKGDKLYDVRGTMIK